MSEPAPTPSTLSPEVAQAAHDLSTRDGEPAFPEQDQQPPGLTAPMEPVPDHGERSYVGHGRLAGLTALITGGDSGIGRAVAIAYAREGADVAVSYLPEEQWGGVEIDDVAAIWALTTALVVAIIVLFATLGRRMKDAKKTLNEGAFGSLLPAFNTACEVGYGAVIAALPAFAIIRDAVLGISSNPAVSAAVATNVLAGVTGSSSGGMSIALDTLGDQFRTMAEAQGIDLELMHRVVTLSAGSFDTLPHSGAIITLLAITGMTHRKSYADIAMCTIVFPLLSAAVAVLLGSLFGAF